MKNIIRVLGCLVIGGLLRTADASAAAITDYCVIPSFIQESILPNLLMVIDNSASMYDLAYADKGRKVCSASTSTTCTTTADCGATGGTCGFASGRQPYYCYDQTYSTVNSYVGYFDSAKSYSYNFTDKTFVEYTPAIDSTSCADGTNTAKLINNHLCVVYTADTSNAVTKFLASGNYLNWLTSSKFDVQKKILTGGKYDGTRLLAESRGCVGQSYMKEALTQNFTNYNSPETNNTNTALGITFGVRGPFDTINPSAPSQGGQTFLDIYKGAFTRRGDCQKAVTTLTSSSSSLADIKKDTCMCLTGDENCTDSGAIAAVVKTKVAYQQSMQACWACQVSETSPYTCTKTDIGIDDLNTVKNQCVSIYDTYATCINDPQKVCTTSADCGGNACQYGPTSIVPGNPALMCGNSYEGQYYFYQAAGVAGKCTATGTACTTNADCAAAKKCSKLVGSETTYRDCTSDATVCTGPGNQCKSVTNTCATSAVTPGWLLRPGVTEDAMKQTHRDFCGLFKAMPITDPTDAPSDTTSYDNIPAILSSTGAEAQLKSPIASLTVRLNLSPAPKGILSEFNKQVRMGAMTFNFAGSATESGSTVPVTNVCSNNPNKVCSIDIDCGASPVTCIPSTNNLDGAKIVHYIGTGHCQTTTGTVCYNNADCPSTEKCISDGVGSWSSGLVKAINDITAASWTPFSEAFYDAMGYYAKVEATGKSRTDLRLNSSDYDENRNPSQYPCQSNNILLISDGMSTADRNSNVDDLAKAYTAAGGATSWTTGAGACPTYGGSVNLDNMSWIARNRNIQTLTTTDSGVEPAKKAERISSYVVFNGDSNGLSGECDSKTLLSQTATNGGTAMYQAVDPVALDTALRYAFRDISGGAASGTAASILSNSEGSGANILQAVFFPLKDFQDDTSARWLGEMQNLWYFVDPFIGNSSVREDTGYTETDRQNNVDHVMNLVSDYVTEFYFDSNTNDTKARLKKDTDGNGSGDALVTNADDSRVTTAVPGVVSADAVNSIWRAGKLLWDRDISSSGDPRTFYTYLYGATATGCTGTFSKTGLFNLLTFNWAEDANNSCILQKYLDAASQDEAKNILRYVHGFDTNTDNTPIVINGKEARSRAVALVHNGPKKVWKLGDIVSSTPRVQSSGKLNNYHLEPAAGYGDTTYADDNTRTGYANSTAYKTRGMVYAGANDGMLHAFNLGTLNVSSQGAVRATLTGTNLGREQWNFVPRHVLPYLKYMSDPAYNHLYTVDGGTKVVDASVGYNDASSAAYMSQGCSADNYWVCERDKSTTGNRSWRTILIGSMGIGGSSRTTSDTACTDKVSTGSCVKTPVEGIGFSSYYALDITDPNAPQFLWDFSDPSLGFTTSGAAVAKIALKFESAGTTYKDTNGRWFAVIGNGPSGPIDTLQFKGKSDKKLKVFILDLKYGPRTGYKHEIESTLDNAFAGSLADATFDADRWNKRSDGFYSDDALYFGYSQCTAGCDTALPTWDGGVARLLTHENLNPAQWELTQLISHTGPVTTSIGRLQDRRNHKLWLYFGSGRYFFKEDDKSAVRSIIGVKDPCYKGNDDLEAPTGDACRNVIDFSSGTGFVNQTTTISTSVGDNGWFITLEGENTTTGYAAERSITDPVAMSNGAVFFTTFFPSVDICSFGGNSYMWGVKYDTGGVAGSSALQGKALVQVSTGSFEEVNLASALTAKGGRKMGTPMVGKPPNDPPPIVSPSANRPLKRIIHIQEK